MTYDSTLHGISDLLGHWRFNAATAVDDVQGNTATIGASVTTGHAGFLYDDATDGSYDFPGPAFGTPGAVSIPHHASYPTTGAFTVCLWIKPDTHTQANTQLFAKLNTGPVRGFGLQFVTHPGGGDPLLSVTTQEPGTAMTTAYGPRITREVVYFVVGTYDGAATLKLYVNGRLYAENAAVPAPPGSSTGDFLINLAGLAQDAALFGRALTLSEVEALYEAGAGACNFAWYTAGYQSTSLGIVAAWPLDEAAASTVSGVSLVEGANGHAGITPASRTAHTALIVAPGGMHLPAQDPVACKDGGTSWKLNTADIGSFPFTRFLVANHAALEPTDFSLVAWVAPQRWPGGIMEKSDGADTGYGMGINAAGRPYVWVGDGGGADVCLADASDTVPVDGRILLVGTYEAATTTLKLYRQHSLVKTLVGTNGLAHAGDLYLGYDHRASAVALERYFGGRMDKFAIHNVVLSASDVLALWEACRCVGQRSRAYLLAGLGALAAGLAPDISGKGVR